MSLDPFVFKRQKFVAMTRLKCYRDTGDVYAFVVNTRRNAARTYKNRLYIEDSKTPLTNFDMINIGYGKSLIRFIDSHNLLMRHTGPKAQVTLVVFSTSTDGVSKDSVDSGRSTPVDIEDSHQDAPCDADDHDSDGNEDSESLPPSGDDAGDSAT